MVKAAMFVIVLLVVAAWFKFKLLQIEVLKKAWRRVIGPLTTSRRGRMIINSVAAILRIKNVEKVARLGVLLRRRPLTDTGSFQARTV